MYEIECEQKSQQHGLNFIVLERPKLNGEYSKMRLISKSLHCFKLKYVMRCRSQDSYIFVFRIGTIPILIKKTYSEVEELTKQGCEDALINKTTKVMVLKPMDKCKNINIETMEIDKFL